jgi:NADPH-dependent methylglyoxal reductase
MSRLLVTGSNGFVGAQVVKQALDNGQTVRGVVRSAEKAAQMKKAFPSEKFEAVVVPSLAGDYTDAVKDVGAIVHAASPFFLNRPFDPKTDFMDPAIEGTTSVLSAAQKAGVKRVVLTGGIGNILSKPNMLLEDTSYGPDDWLPLTYEQGISGKLPAAAVYYVSKKYAEVAAWDFAKQHPEMQLSVIIPAVIYGPLAQPISSLKDLNVSSSLIYALLNGVLPPDAVPVFCDVTSLAQLHLKALQSDEAIGKRIPFAKGPGTIYSILDIIKKNRPDLASRLPPTPEADALAGKPIAKVDSSFAMEKLGVPGLDLKETVLQTVDSLLSLEKKLGAPPKL